MISKQNISNFLILNSFLWTLFFSSSSFARGNMAELEVRLGKSKNLLATHENIIKKRYEQSRISEAFQLIKEPTLLDLDVRRNLINEGEDIASKITAMNEEIRRLGAQKKMEKLASLKKERFRKFERLKIIVSLIEADANVFGTDRFIVPRSDGSYEDSANRNELKAARREYIRNKNFDISNPPIALEHVEKQLYGDRYMANKAGTRFSSRAKVVGGAAAIAVAGAAAIEIGTGAISRKFENMTAPDRVEAATAGSAQ